MAGSSQEIIDLTRSDGPEVIVLDDDGPSQSSTGKEPRRSGAAKETKRDTPLEEDSEVIVIEDEEEQQSSKPSKKRKKARRKKKRSLVDAEGGEDGEVLEVETANTSTQISREVSDVDSIGQEQDVPSRTPGKRSKRNAKERLGLLARITDVPALLQQDLIEDNSEDDGDDTLDGSKSSNKLKRKRKTREKPRANRKPSKQNKEPSPPSDEPPPFFIDNGPAELPNNSLSVLPPPVLLAPLAVSDGSIHTDNNKLLLPPHVSVLYLNGDTPIVEIKAPEPLDSDEEDYIDYVDYDGDQVRGPRYFDAVDENSEAKTSKSSRMVCKRCGAENEHKTQECPVLVCLTCGARNEHSTRSCPISKTCFSCGMKGHINRDCPNRYSRRTRHEAYEDCGRCGSPIHTTSECPTLWRIYEYVTESERKAILDEREKKSTLEIGDGGEGYIGPEEWCYNCGGCGHLGDDCQELSFPYNHPKEPSAFSQHATRSGPFSDAKRESRPQSKAALYAQKAEEAWGDGHGSLLPLDVGLKGKQKEKARMQKRAQELQEDDGDDWFAGRAGGSRTPNGRDKRSGGTPKGPRNGKTLSFGNLGRDDDRYGRGRKDRDRDWDRDRRDRRDDRDRRSRDYDSRSSRPGRYDLPEPSRETDSIQIRGASKKGGDTWGVSIRGAASRYSDDREPETRDDLFERRRYERSRDDRSGYGRKRDRREASPRREPRYRGGYSR
ncbi:hypothetical protein BDY19DRAFT_132957 [Irpex rosettiformis]|uniref:Uncharacterized protein n=1 Tax=Irpex rosettiformis TaxID=378272 RepID=A0ACB8U4N1_9APHY|nr:hypothetical protein BDY19DRAFT_132957 [Irpex rosettiformis]